jgi:hypothetical protein
VPTGDFNLFVKNLDDTLKQLCKPKVELLIFWDIKKDYPIESTPPPPPQKKIASLLTTYDVWHTVNFAARIQNNSITATDHICVDNSRPSLSFLFPIINGLSDHYAQILSKTYMQQ